MELVLDLLITAVGVVVVGQYTWSGKGHFSSEKMPRGALLISAVVLVTSLTLLYLVWAQPQPLAAQLVGLGLMLFSWWLFWQAIRASRSAQLRLAFDEAGPRGLVTEGPYRLVRHPFYTSYVIFWAGWTIAVWSVVAIFPFAILVVIYVFAALTEERKFVGTPMAAEYEAYKLRTGFFWPRLGADRPAGSADRPPRGGSPIKSGGTASAAGSVRVDPARSGAGYGSSCPACQTARPAGHCPSSSC